MPLEPPKFEIHLTFEGSHAERVEQLQFKSDNVWRFWKFSKIDGDPVLGQGVRAYLSAYSFTKEGALTTIAAAKANLEQEEIKLCREKIEQIVHDIEYVEAPRVIG
jgi:hypothetical protein